MKPVFVFTALFFVARMSGAGPASTYTFVDPCTPIVTISSIQGTYGCYLFSASNGLLPGQPGGTYQWKFDDGASASGSVVAHCYNPAAVPAVRSATVTFNSPALCGVQPAYRIFTLSVPAKPDDSCIQINPEVLQSAESVTVLGGVTIPEMMRSIDFGDGTGPGNNPEHTYTGCGPFVITVKTWDMNFPCYICYAYHAVNIACKEIATGVEEEHAGRAKPYPNPCNDRLYINNTKTPSAVLVTDVLGRTNKLDYESDGGKLSIPLEGLERGIFFVKIEYLDKSADVFKIMKN